MVFILFSEGKSRSQDPGLIIKECDIKNISLQEATSVK